MIARVDHQRFEAAGTLSPGSICDFSAVITSGRKDRDGDILEVSGAIVDPNAPLLWQHDPNLPIGKVLRTTKSTDRLSGDFMIADTDLGRDAAALVEAGALRISHGFEPIEFDPLQGKGGRWHIKRYNVVEVSLVSIPSNVDAVITAYNRKNLRSPVMKAWAAKLAGHKCSCHEKAGREFSAANLDKLKMAKAHLDHALSKPEHFHPVAGTLVEKAHGIISGMCQKGEPSAYDDAPMKSGLSIIRAGTADMIDWTKAFNMIGALGIEEPEAMVDFAERLLAHAKKVQRQADIDLVCEYLFA